MSEVLVGTKKGLFVLRGGPGDVFDVAGRAFAGDVVEYATRDPRTGRYLASVTSGFYGPRLMWTDGDPTGEWQQADGPAFPEGGDITVERIWRIEPGEADGLLYAGVAPASLFTSTDGGESWSLNEPLWKERLAGEWNPGAGGLALHSICPWPGDPDRLAVGVSAAGVWRTDDGGQTWQSGFTGLVAGYMPEDQREGTNALCVHNMYRSPARPERMMMQFHGGVYRSDDEGATWNDIAAGLPSDFGFPMVIDPEDPDSGFVIPLVGAEDRVTPEGALRVYETRDAGAGWTPRTHGLPQSDAWLTIYRTGLRRRRGRRRDAALLRRDVGRGVRLRRRRHDLAYGCRTPRPRHQRPRLGALTRTGDRPRRCITSERVPPSIGPSDPDRRDRSWHSRCRSSAGASSATNDRPSTS